MLAYQFFSVTIAYAFNSVSKSQLWTFFPYFDMECRASSIHYNTIAMVFKRVWLTFIFDHYTCKTEHNKDKNASKQARARFGHNDFRIHSTHCFFVCRFSLFYRTLSSPCEELFAKRINDCVRTYTNVNCKFWIQLAKSKNNRYLVKTVSYRFVSLICFFF